MVSLREYTNSHQSRLVKWTFYNQIRMHALQGKRRQKPWTVGKKKQAADRQKQRASEEGHTVRCTHSSCLKRDLVGGSLVRNT